MIFCQVIVTWDTVRCCIYMAQGTKLQLCFNWYHLLCVQVGKVLWCPQSSLLADCPEFQKSLLTLYCPMMPYGVMTFVNSPYAYGNLHQDRHPKSLVRLRICPFSSSKLVPRSTLGDRISGRVLPGAVSGKPRYLSPEEEKEQSVSSLSASVWHWFFKLSPRPRYVWPSIEDGSWFMWKMHQYTLAKLIRRWALTRENTVFVSHSQCMHLWTFHESWSCVKHQHAWSAIITVVMIFRQVIVTWDTVRCCIYMAQGTKLQLCFNWYHLLCVQVGKVLWCPQSSLLADCPEFQKSLLTLYCPMTPYGVMTLVNSPYAYGNLYGAFNTRHFTLVQSFCFFWLFLMGCKEFKQSFVVFPA